MGDSRQSGQSRVSQVRHGHASKAQLPPGVKAAMISWCHKASCCKQLPQSHDEEAAMRRCQAAAHVVSVVELLVVSVVSVGQLDVDVQLHETAVQGHEGKRYNMRYRIDISQAAGANDNPSDGSQAWLIQPSANMPTNLSESIPPTQPSLRACHAPHPARIFPACLTTAPTCPQCASQPADAPQTALPAPETRHLGLRGRRSRQKG